MVVTHDIGPKEPQLILDNRAFERLTRYLDVEELFRLHNLNQLCRKGDKEKFYHINCQLRILIIKGLSKKQKIQLWNYRAYYRFFAKQQPALYKKLQNPEKWLY